MLVLFFVGSSILFSSDLSFIITCNSIVGRLLLSSADDSLCKFAKKRIYVRLRFYRRLHINAIILIKVIRLEMFSLIRITFI